MEKAYLENSVMSTEISRYLFHRYQDNNLSETGFIKWRKNHLFERLTEEGLNGIRLFEVVVSS
jgi:hypothetical protein